MDMMAPFIHEFTYQAMANDLLPIEDGTRYTWVPLPSQRHHAAIPVASYKFQSSVGSYEDKTATLSDADSVWTEVRHMHMREVIDKLMSDFNKFMQENAGFKGCVETYSSFRNERTAYSSGLWAVREGAASLNDMKDMLANLPQYQEQREKVS
jgi:syntaxin-binding protein 1